MKLFNEDLLTISVEKSKKETIVTANVGRVVWLAFVSLIVMVLFVKR
ncbi:hypothetical protein OIT44_04280 [Weissella ceti]|uniref:Uncharacterized protein n=1 Tax=Weissella ceti TaxID=759620 RepID=A0ABT3E4H0_9LACO|nr:hypothetical protein [Weissella ceti]MCW0953292.1 hypothetical protein [Weissella ceti]QVK11400.1 hypothetical protein KHQ31_04035 [Weissella ceti]